MIPNTIDLADVAARFGDRLHAAGVAVTPAMSGRFAAALSAAEPRRVDELYWLARVTLVVDRNDLAMFRRVTSSATPTRPGRRPAATGSPTSGSPTPTTSKPGPTSSPPPARTNGSGPDRSTSAARRSWSACAA